MAITINGTTGIAGVDGSASTPAVQGTDTNTGIFFPAADTIAFGEGGAEVARFDSSGNLGIGTSSPAFNDGSGIAVYNATAARIKLGDSTSGIGANDGLELIYDNDAYVYNRENTALIFGTNNAERARITSGGELQIGKTATSFSTAGSTFYNSGTTLQMTRSGGLLMELNRLTNDGNLVEFYQDTTLEGAISVSGTTVTYGGGHLARYSQLPDGSKDETLLKGTVLTNLDEMCVWVNKDTGVSADNEQCNKVKVSDVEGDVNVAGVFVSWTYDEQHDTNDLFVAMTGDMIIRIAQGVVVQKGDLLMSAGDGTAKPQGDDIVRSKTVAKVTSNHVTCTYADGSYCVPCVLMAC